MTNSSIPHIPPLPAEQNSFGVKSPPDFVDFEQRLQDLEAKDKLSSQTIIDIQAYVTDMKKDMNSIRRMRLSAFWMSIGYAIAVNAAVLTLLFHYREYFKELSSYAQIFIPALALSSTIGLLMAILRGTFKTYNERHKEDYIPPHLKGIIDAVSEVSKTSSDS